MDFRELKQFLDRKVQEYNRPLFVREDPVSVPHLFSRKQDIEISGLFAATFAWGNRTTIIQKSRELMRLMDDSPYDFIITHEARERKRFERFCHRTFNATDLLYFIEFLQHHYRKSGTLETAFTDELQPGSVNNHEPVQRYLNAFSKNFFSLGDVPDRTRKHVSAPFKNSACKRLNMYLRWMVRKDNCGVDFGLWKRISPSQLICPLDLHVARVARHFGLLTRRQADWQSAVELTRRLREFDPADPVKYDFALFALGVIEKF